MTSFDKGYYRSQAQKRLRLAYEYARSDLESGNYVEVYHLCAGIAGVEVGLLFSGPENNVWHDIRVWGRYLRFYPEYPIRDDYVDFAEPYKKIVIEVDSGLHNRQKDAAKDIRLKNAGYRVIRIEKKYAEKDLEYLHDAIQGAKSAGRDDVAESLEAQLSKNSEAILRKLRNEFTPQERVSKEDLLKTVAVGEIWQTEEFQKHYAKYYERPAELDEAIATIPLTR